MTVKFVDYGFSAEFGCVRKWYGCYLNDTLVEQFPSFESAKSFADAYNEKVE